MIKYNILKSKFFVLSFIVLILCQNSFALQLRRKPEQLLNKAHTIVSAKIIHISSSQSLGSSFPKSKVVLSVHETLKGDHKESIEIEILGGKHKNGYAGVSFLPRFYIGDEAIFLFKDLENKTSLPIVGNHKGVIFKKNINQQNEKAYEELLSDIRRHIKSNSPIFQGQWPESYCSCKNYKSRSKTGIKSFGTFGKIPSSSMPLRIEARPSSDAIMKGVDVAMMDIWNESASVFDYFNGDGEWNWDNGLFEIGGFVSNRELQENFGFTWEDEDMIGTIAFVLPNVNDQNEIVEADLILNPSIDYTTDDDLIIESINTTNLNFIMMHELGHVLGFEHEFGKLSVMNYYQPQYLNEYSLKGDDVAGLMDLYPSSVLQRSDIGVYLFNDPSPEPFDLVDVGADPAILEPGLSFDVKQFVIDNAGTTNANNFKINWFLTDDIRSTSTKISLGSTTHTLSAASQKKSNASLTIPDDMSFGKYYLMAETEFDGDENDSNNRCWSFIETRVVRDITALPFVHAGSDQYVLFGDTVTLTGKNSVNTEGLTFNWKLLKGETVDLTANEKEATFIAPSSEQVLEFELEVGGQTDEVKVYVVKSYVSAGITFPSFRKDADGNTITDRPPTPNFSNVTGGGGCLMKRLRTK